MADPVVAVRCMHCGGETCHELHDTPELRVLSRFQPVTEYAEPADPAAVLMGLYIDVETTGLDVDTCEPVELAVLPFSFCPIAGRILNVLPGRAFFEEPSKPIPEAVQRIHGITDAMVKGQRIDSRFVGSLAGSAAIVIAHNASYDRPVTERRIHEFRRQPWGCSYRDVPWEDAFGCVGGKLVHVLQYTHRQFYDAHRALDDCQVGLHCLTAEDGAGRTAFSYLLERAREKTTRLWAEDSPFERKDRLKAFRPRFQWSDGGIQRKGWYVDLRPHEIAGVRAFLEQDIYGYPNPPIRERTFGARDRFSKRVNP